MNLIEKKIVTHQHKIFPRKSKYYMKKEDSQNDT